MIENVSAVLKDIKVTSKGITIALENVKFTGDQLTDVAALIGDNVVVTLASPQMNLFEDEDVNEIGEPEEQPEVEEDKETPSENVDQISFFDGVAPPPVEEDDLSAISFTEPESPGDNYAQATDEALKELGFE